MLHEFGASCEFINYPSYKACWVKYENETDIESLKSLWSNNLFLDKNKNLVYIAESQYSLERAKEKNPKAEFLLSIEHNDLTLELDKVA